MFILSRTRRYLYLSSYFEVQNFVKFNLYNIYARVARIHAYCIVHGKSLGKIRLRMFVIGDTFLNYMIATILPDF